MPKPNRRHDHPDLRAAHELRAEVDRIVAARRAYTPTSRRLAIVKACGADALVSPKLVADLRQLPRLDDDEQARVHGAVDDDPPEIIGVLLRLELGDSLSAAARLTAAAFAADEEIAVDILQAGAKSRHADTERLRKLADPESRADRKLRQTGAYERWRASVTGRLAGCERVAGYPRDRIKRLRFLVEKHS